MSGAKMIKSESTVEDSTPVPSSIGDVLEDTTGKQSHDLESGNETVINEDENTVWWDGDDDPQNPLNWPSWRKTLNAVILSSMAFVTPLASCKTI